MYDSFAGGIVKGIVNVIREQAWAEDIVCIANDIRLVRYTARGFDRLLGSGVARF